MASKAHLEPLLKGIPAKPGCYLMKGADGQVLYVGKAVNLRSRVRSYFQHAATLSSKTRELVRRVEEVEWIVVGSELEALILEMHLIKRHRPKYNVRLKDDKRYPYIRVHWSDPFPKVSVTRRVLDDGSRFFGPYTSVWAVHQTLDVLRKIFPYLTCDRVITGQDPRACLYYDIKLCAGPCIGAIDQAAYRAMIKDMMGFLEGKSEAIVTRLREAMARAAAEMRYEQAALLRDQLAAIEKVVEGQRVVTRDRTDYDVIAFARDEREACVQVFFIRRGKLIGREYFLLDGAAQAEDRELLEAFVKQFYAEATHVPQAVLLPTDLEEARIIEAWLRGRRGGRKVHLLVPRRGVKRELLRMAAENAADTLAALRASWEADRSKHVAALVELQQALGLGRPPNRIECYDISNLQGTAASGSMVVFEQGAPAKRLYRHFSIQRVEGQDDFASMQEVLERRLRRYRIAQQEAAKPGGKLDPAFGRLPDLLLVDGGVGQLNRARAVLKRYELEDKIALAALAKRHEELYIVGRKEPIRLPRRSQALFLVQRVRDEAHRFALRHHHRLRRKTGLASQLEAIEGIGPAKRKALLQAFDSVEAIQAADIQALAQVKGIGPRLAQRIKAGL